MCRDIMQQVISTYLTNLQSARTTDGCSWAGFTSSARDDTRTCSYGDKQASMSSLSWRWHAAVSRDDVSSSSVTSRWRMRDDAAGAIMMASVSRRLHWLRPPIARSSFSSSTKTSFCRWPNSVYRHHWLTVGRLLTQLMSEHWLTTGRTSTSAESDAAAGLYAAWRGLGRQTVLSYVVVSYGASTTPSILS